MTSTPMLLKGSALLAHFQSAFGRKTTGRGPGRYAPAMDLEEHTLETAGDRCEECGAKLTEQELRTVLESGGPTLCAIHANEVVPVADDTDTVGEDY